MASNAASLRIASDFDRALDLLAEPETPEAWTARYGGPSSSYERSSTPPCCAKAITLRCVCGVAYGCRTHGVRHCGSHE